MTQHIFVGEGAPNIVPQYVAAHYSDTLTGNQYLAVGTDSADDWRLSALATGSRLVADGGELSIGQDVRVIVADMTAQGGDLVLTLTAAAMRGGATFELFPSFNPEVGLRHIVIRGPSEQDQVDATVSWFWSDGHGKTDGDGEHGYQILLWAMDNLYPWFRVTVADGAVFVQYVK